MSKSVEDFMTAEEIKSYENNDFGTVQERVARGVRFLDRTKPDWRANVSLPKFDIKNECLCVLGQVFQVEALESYDDYITDGYTYGGTLFESIPPNSQSPETFFGFDALYGKYDEDVLDFEELQAEWTRVIGVGLDA